MHLPDERSLSLQHDSGPAATQLFVGTGNDSVVIDAEFAAVTVPLGEFEFEISDAINGVDRLSVDLPDGYVPSVVSPHSITYSDGVGGTFVVHRGSFRFHQDALPADVNADGSVTARDALLVLNRLALNADPHQWGDRYFPDVNADGKLSPIDALRVINAVARHAMETLTSGEGESVIAHVQTRAATVGAVPQDRSAWDVSAVDRVWQLF